MCMWRHSRTGGNAEEQRHQLQKCCSLSSLHSRLSNPGQQVRQTQTLCIRCSHLTICKQSFRVYSSISCLISTGSMRLAMQCQLDLDTQVRFQSPLQIAASVLSCTLASATVLMRLFASLQTRYHLQQVAVHTLYALASVTQQVTTFFFLFAYLMQLFASLQTSITCRTVAVHTLYTLVSVAMSS